VARIAQFTTPERLVTRAAGPRAWVGVWVEPPGRNTNNRNSSGCAAQGPRDPQRSQEPHVDPRVSPAGPRVAAADPRPPARRRGHRPAVAPGRHRPVAGRTLGEVDAGAAQPTAARPRAARLLRLLRVGGPDPAEPL